MNWTLYLNRIKKFMESFRSELGQLMRSSAIKIKNTLERTTAFFQIQTTGFVFLIIILMLSAPGLAQQKATVTGSVVDGKTGEPIKGVIVTIIALNKSQISNQYGKFWFEDIPPGEYIFSFLSPEYGRTFKANQRIKAGEENIIGMELVKGLKDEDTFAIGGIEVVAEKELLPQEPETKTSITQGELEHIQASSLGDILELIPGQKFDNPGLQHLKQIQLRQAETLQEAENLNSLGTQVLLDGIPLSNNANLQIDTRINTGGVRRTTANSGIDLRQIPADMIESVEVIRGIPSAKFGDLSAGAIQVNTHTTVKPPRIKYKHNPNTKEFNFNGGFNLWKTGINYNVNYARSDRNFRLENNYFSRVSGQLSFTNQSRNKRYRTQNRIFYTRIFDEQGIRPNDFTLNKSYNRDYTVRFAHKTRYLWGNDRKWTANVSLDFTRQNSYKSRLISSDNTYISNRLEPGTQEGEYVQNYISEQWVKGKIYHFYFNTEYQYNFFTGWLFHNFLTGVNYRYEVNNGPGKVFDQSKPPSITNISRDRPRRYSDIPGLSQISFFAEDKITGNLWREFTLQFGFRYESYQPTTVSPSGLFENGDLFAAKSGSFFNPRLNFVYYVGKNTQLRAGYGTTSKTPPLSLLYPNPGYFDIDDINRFTDDPEKRLAVISTYVVDRTNDHLKGFQETKTEVSLDQRIGSVGVTFTAYRNRVRDGFRTSRKLPLTLYKYNRPNWPDVAGSTIRDTLFAFTSIAANLMNVNNKGAEVSLQTRQLPLLGLSFRLEGAYNSTKTFYSGDYEYASTYRYDPLIGSEIIPFWNRLSKESEHFLFNYKMDFTIKELGLWITLAAQYTLFDKDRTMGLDDSLAVGYYTKAGKMVFIPESKRWDPTYQNLRRTYADYFFRTENRKDYWLINLRVSKSIFEGFELSFFVNNLFNSHPLYRRNRVPPGSLSYQLLNPDLYYGIEFSGILDGIFK